MKFNQTLALDILGMSKPKDNCHRFILSLSKLKELIDRGVVDGEDCQNSSPTIADLVAYAENEKLSDEEISFEAYIVTDREDSRISVEGFNVNFKGSKKKSDKINKFINAFHSADEFEINVNTGLGRAWWD
jgi:hypothetical protein